MKKVTKFVAEDGTSFNTEQDCLLHEGKFVCPACSGKGTTRVKYNAYPSGLPDSGWVEDWQYKYTDCTTCSGKGHTAAQLRPVTAVVGYE